MGSLLFLNSALLWGLGLASIPLIIHLLFRRRFKQVEWAPMRYLKLTIQRNRRRIQIEQLLLLLLRTALIVLLVGIVSRPVLNASGIGRWLGGDTRTSHIVVLDDSLSMGLTSGGKSSFDRTLDLAAQGVEDVGRKDRFTLATSSQPKSPLLREVDLADRSEALALLRTLTPTETFTSWGATLKAVDELVESSTFPARTVTIMTDLRRAGWEEDLALPARWQSDQVRVRIIDVGGIATKQVSLESLVQVDRLALVGTPVRFDAVLRNWSDAPLENIEATWLIDGRPSEISLPPLAPGETVTAPLTATFQEPGVHHVSLRLPTDDLPGDNQRWNIVHVKDNLHLMLVDGEPSAEPFQSETDFLALALSLAIGESRAFQVETITDSELSLVATSDPDLIVLANVASLDTAQVELLQKLVAGGAGLMIFPGDQIDPESYNRLLFRDGAGLLPAQFDAPQDETVTGLILEENSPSAVDALRQLSAPVLERIKIDKRYQVKLAVEEDPAVRVLARWNDTASSPALIEKTIGRGRVLLWTIAADRSWSDWPTEPSYVLAMREITKAIARSGGAPQDVVAGEVIRQPVSIDRRVISPTIELPGGDEPRTLMIDADESTDGEKTERGQALVWGDTRKAGLYRLNWQESPGGAAASVYAANPDSRESDLARLSVDDLRRKWAGVNPEIITAFATADASVGVRGKEIWRTLAYWLAGLMGIEACFATWVGRQR